MRKERKEHGLQRWIEGPELAPGRALPARRGCRHHRRLHDRGAGARAQRGPDGGGCRKRARPPRRRRAGDPERARRGAGRVHRAHHDRRHLSRSGPTGDGLAAAAIPGSAPRCPAAARRHVTAPPAGAPSRPRHQMRAPATSPSCWRCSSSWPSTRILCTSCSATEKQLQRSAVRPPPGGRGVDRRAATTRRRWSATRSTSPPSRASSRVLVCGWRISSCAPPTAARASAERCWRRLPRACASAAAAPGMGRARLERTGAALLQRPRAQTMPEWITHRLTGEDLDRLAAVDPPRCLRHAAQHQHQRPVAFQWPRTARAYALVVQWIRQPPPKRWIQVRLLAGALVRKPCSRAIPRHRD